MDNILALARLAQVNEADEAQAIVGYTDMLAAVEQAGLSEQDYKEIVSVITEIVSDELNHQERLRALYTRITGIVANKD